MFGVASTPLQGPMDGMYRAVQNGQWDDPSVWADGAVPDDDARVLIERGVIVTVAHQGTARLKTVHVDGTLTFDPTVDTHLQVDTLVTNPRSTLRIGTPSTPIEAGTEARITFIDTGPIDEAQDPGRRRRGLLVNGDLTVHGAAKTSWTELARFPAVGDRQLSLPATPTNWKAGDRLVVPGVNPNENRDEERRIEAVAGTTVRLDCALEYDHIPPADDLDGYVLNLSRNVMFESESAEIPRRGHVMVMNPATDVRYAAFRELGRTDKSQAITDPVRGTAPDDAETNPKARYSFHYHKTGIEQEPHRAEGVVVDGSPGWGIVNHHSHAEVTDSITYDVLGAGFVAEGGNERGSFGRNFALRSKGSGDKIDDRAFGTRHASIEIDDFGHAGHGFWSQSPIVELTDNVAAGHRHYGFAIWTRQLLDGPMAECTQVEDSRVTYCPNLPMEYVEGQKPLMEAISAGRFSHDHDELMRDTDKVPSCFVRLERFEGNEAFASAGGLDFSRNSFKWKHERFDQFSEIRDFTVYNVGPHIDDEGNTRGVVKNGAKKGGNQGIKLRYLSNVAVRDCRLLGTDGTGVGIPGHDYFWTNIVENCDIRGWNLGVVPGEHRTTIVRDNVLDNAVDIDWKIGNTGPLVAERNDDGAGKQPLLRHDLSYDDVKAGELLGLARNRGTVLDGRTVYYEEQRPDYVPIKSEAELVTVTTGGSYGHMTDVIGHDDAGAVIGLTNQELMDQFGVSLGGSLLPDTAVGEDYVTGGVLDPINRSTPPEAAWLDVAAGDILSGAEVVSDANTESGEAVRVTTGTDEPPADDASVVSINFDVSEGTYSLYGRFFTRSWNGDTVYTRIDDGTWNAWEKLKPPNGFKWYTAAPNDESEYTWDLSAGTHTLEIGCPNDGVLLDKLFIASDATILGGFGQPAQNR
ncbi:G8 domain-containing protein [Halococcus saccharolyticus]|nr:G8 domain-containing protein [Halococcus saccharolyticus]